MSKALRRARKFAVQMRSEANPAGKEVNMRYRLFLLLIAVVAVLGTGIAQGKECKGVNFPDQTQVDGTTLTLNGLGLRQATVLKVNVYVAALYVVKPSNDAKVILESNTPKELILSLRAQRERFRSQQSMGGRV